MTDGRRWIGKLAGLALLTATLLRGGPARAFTLMWDPGNARTINPWNTSHLVFDYDLSACPSGVTADQVLGSVNAAIDLWNSAPSANLAISLGSAVSLTVAQAKAKTSGNPVILCDPTMSADVQQDANGIPAASVPIAVDPDWRLSFDVIYLNAESGKQANIAHVYSVLPDVMPIVLAHEMGHALGLGHSSDPNALMYYDASSKTKLALSEDDLDGISYLYPRKEPGQGRIFGCATLAAAHGGSGKGGESGGDGYGGLGAVQLAAFFAFCAAAVRFLKRSPRLLASSIG